MFCVLFNYRNLEIFYTYSLKTGSSCKNKVLRFVSSNMVDVVNSVNDRIVSKLASWLESVTNTTNKSPGEKEYVPVRDHFRPPFQP